MLIVCFEVELLIGWLFGLVWWLVLLVGIEESVFVGRIVVLYRQFAGGTCLFLCLLVPDVKGSLIVSH